MLGSLDLDDIVRLSKELSLLSRVSDLNWVFKILQHVYFLGNEISHLLEKKLLGSDLLGSDL